MKRLFGFKKSELKGRDFFAAAQDGVQFIKTNFTKRKLSLKGERELLLFNSAIIRKAKSFTNNKNKLEVQVDYFLDLIDEIKDVKEFSSEKELTNFVNERLNLYTDEYYKLMTNSLYTPMLCFSNFYVDPLHDGPSEIKEVVGFGELMLFQSQFNQMISQIIQKIK